MIECNGVGVVQEAALDTRLHPEGRQEYPMFLSLCE